MIPHRTINLELVSLLKKFPNTPLHDFVAAIILSVLERNNGNRTHAAKELKISLRTLRNQIHVIKSLGYDVIPSEIGRKPNSLN